MANERTYPLLPCADIDQAISFYESLGFTRTYRQLAPNPCAVVNREDIHIHLFGMPNFDPAQSYGSVIIVVPDPDELYQAFAVGLRAAYGKLPTVGFPRITRPRKKFGTVSGFSVIDVGGNWLRISKLNDKEPDKDSPKTTGLLGILETAARLGDANGDEAKAIKTLENGSKRYADAPKIDYARAMLYHAELAVRVGNVSLAESWLAAVRLLKLTPAEKKSIATELAQTVEIVEQG